jgi:hypothetical protein
VHGLPVHAMLFLEGTWASLDFWNQSPTEAERWLCWKTKTMSADDSLETSYNDGVEMLSRWRQD